MINLLLILFLTNAFAQDYQQEDMVGSPLTILYLNKAKLRLAYDLAKARHHLHLRPHLLMQPNPTYLSDNQEKPQGYHEEQPNNYHIANQPNQFQPYHQINALIPNHVQDYKSNYQENIPFHHDQLSKIDYQPNPIYGNHFGVQGYNGNYQENIPFKHDQSSKIDYEHNPVIENHYGIQETFLETTNNQRNEYKQREDYDVPIPETTSSNPIKDDDDPNDDEYLLEMDKKLINILQQMFGFLVYTELRKANSTSINTTDESWSANARTSVPFTTKPSAKEGPEFWKFVQKNIKTYAKITGFIDVVNTTDRVFNISDSSIKFHSLQNRTEEEVIEGQNTEVFEKKMTEHLRKLFQTVLEEQAKQIEQFEDGSPVLTESYTTQNDANLLAIEETTTEDFFETTTTFVPGEARRKFTKKFEKLMGKFMHKMFTYMMSEKVLEDIYSEENTDDMRYDSDGTLKSSIFGAVRNMTIDYEKAGQEFYQYIKKHIRLIGDDGKRIDATVLPQVENIDGSHDLISADSIDNIEEKSNESEVAPDNSTNNSNISDESATNDDGEFENKYKPRMTKLLDRMMKHMIRKEKFERAGKNKISPKPSEEIVESNLKPELVLESPGGIGVERFGNDEYIEENTTQFEERTELNNQEDFANSQARHFNAENIEENTTQSKEKTELDNQEDLANSQARHFHRGFHSHLPVEHHHHHHFQPNIPSHIDHFPQDGHFSKPHPSSHITINKQQNFVSPNHGQFNINQNNQDAFHQFNSNHHSLFIRNHEDGGRLKRHTTKTSKKHLLSSNHFPNQRIAKDSPPGLHQSGVMRIPEDPLLGHIIWVPSNVYHRVYKRSIPLLKLIADPDVKIDMAKTMENVGTIAKNSFEDQKAPMYHIRNMIGSAKNVILSSMKIPPQDAIIPSQYKILDRTNMKKLQAPQMRSRFRETSESVDLSDQVVETFQRVGAMLRDSIKSGQEALQHMTDVAHSARKAVVTTGFSSPRLLMPYVKATAIKKDKNPEKVMLIAPRIADLTREDDDVANPSEEYLKIGDLMDAFGVSNPERKKVGLRRFIMHPKKSDVTLQSRFSGDDSTKRDNNKYFIVAENIDDGDASQTNEFDEAIDTLKEINSVVGSKPLKSFLSKINEELSKDTQNEINKFILNKPLMGLLKPEKSLPPAEANINLKNVLNNATSFDPDEILKMADEDLKEILKFHNEPLEEDKEVEATTQPKKRSFKELYQRSRKLKNISD